MGDMVHDMDQNLNIPGDWGDFNHSRLNGNDDYSVNELNILDLDKQQDIFHD